MEGVLEHDFFFFVEASLILIQMVHGPSLEKYFRMEREESVSFLYTNCF